MVTQNKTGWFSKCLKYDNYNHPCFLTLISVLSSYFHFQKTHTPLHMMPKIICLYSEHNVFCLFGWMCNCRRWWAPPSPPRCVRSSWWRRAVWWSDRWRAVWRRVTPPQRRVSCSDRWTWRLAQSARPSVTCCSTCATTPAAASRSDATTRPPTPSWP